MYMLVFLLWWKRVAIHFKVVLTRVTLYVPKPAGHSENRNVPCSLYTTLTHEDFSGLLSDKTLGKTRECQWGISTWHLLCSSECICRTSHKAKFGPNEKPWSSACFSLLTLRWICFSVLKTKQTKISFFNFKIILWFLDSNLYEGAANLCCLRGWKRLHFREACSFSKLVCKREKVISDILHRHWCLQAPLLPDT